MNAAVDLRTARALAASERWFEVLGISPFASEDDTKRACRAARVSTHPDRGHDQLELAQIVNQAADRVMGLVAKPFALYDAHFGSEAPQWALHFEAVLASFLPRVTEQLRTTLVQDLRAEFSRALPASPSFSDETSLVTFCSWRFGCDSTRRGGYRARLATDAFCSKCWPA